uniref:(northern house mosquito) hypothetical protein n=1 Tax=Culex pipiens TaxID=7175 RepID=A0A8D8KS22_CULPI
MINIKVFTVIISAAEVNSMKKLILDTDLSRCWWLTNEEWCEIAFVKVESNLRQNLVRSFSLDSASSKVFRAQFATTCSNIPSNCCTITVNSVHRLFSKVPN